MLRNYPICTKKPYRENNLYDSRQDGNADAEETDEEPAEDEEQEDERQKAPPRRVLVFATHPKNEISD